MKTTTGITLVAIGAVLCFAISLHPGFISPQIVGVILMLTGIAGLCLRHRRLLDRQLARLRDLLGQDGNLSGGKRVALDDLLRTAGGAAAAPSSQPDEAAGKAASPWTGPAPGPAPGPGAGGIADGPRSLVI